MSSKKSRKPKKIIKKDEKISSIIEVKENDNKIVYILILVIIILLCLVVFYAFFNKSKTDCSVCKSPTVEIEVEPKEQLINYDGFRFKMPLDWDFVGDDDTYKISNKDENIFISFETLNYEFDLFESDEIQKNFQETIQTSNNIKIDLSKKDEKYYIYEGKYNDYNYLIIAIGNKTKTILIKTQFIDKISFEKLKKDVIDFSISGIKDEL